MAKRVINLSRHEFSDAQRGQLARLLGVTEARALVVHQLLPGDSRRRLLPVGLEQPLGPQCATLVDSLNITAAQWNEDAIFLVPPDLAAVATVALAYIHGIGRFPHLVWRKPAAGGEGFDVAGVVDLAALRTDARASSLA